MTIRDIARMGNPVLQKPAAKVDDPTSADIKRLAEDMIETMYAASGTGLGAPQIHEPLRVLVFYVSRERLMREGEDEAQEAPLTVLINPELEILSDKRVYGWEGCLSVPGLVGYVARSPHITYKGLDLAGQKVEREAKGFHARVVQHEFDHLEGILYPQRMDDIKKLIFLSEWAYDADAPEYIKQTAIREQEEEEDVLGVWEEVERSS